MACIFSQEWRAFLVNGIIMYTFKMKLVIWHSFHTWIVSEIKMNIHRQRKIQFPTKGLWKVHYTRLNLMLFTKQNFKFDGQPTHRKIKLIKEIQITMSDDSAWNSMNRIVAYRNFECIKHTHIDCVELLWCHLRYQIARFIVMAKWFIEQKKTKQKRNQV